MTNGTGELSTGTPYRWKSMEYDASGRRAARLAASG